MSFQLDIIIIPVFQADFKPMLYEIHFIITGSHEIVYGCLVINKSPQYFNEVNIILDLVFNFGVDRLLLFPEFGRTIDIKSVLISGNGLYG